MSGLPVEVSVRSSSIHRTMADFFSESQRQQLAYDLWQRVRQVPGFSAVLAVVVDPPKLLLDGSTYEVIIRCSLPAGHSLVLAAVSLQHQHQAGPVVMGFDVHEQLQGQGFGRMIHDTIVADFVKHHQAGMATLNVVREDAIKGSAKFWAKMGYKPLCGVRLQPVECSHHACRKDYVLQNGGPMYRHY